MIAICNSLIHTEDTDCVWTKGKNYEVNVYDNMVSIQCDDGVFLLSLSNAMVFPTIPDLFGLTMQQILDGEEQNLKSLFLHKKRKYFRDWRNES